MRTGDLGFPFRACHRAVVKQKQGPCPSRMLAPEGPTLPIPSPDPSQLTMGCQFFVPLSLGRKKRVGPWEDPETRFPYLISGLNPWNLQELVFSSGGDHERCQARA